MYPILAIVEPNASAPIAANGASEPAGDTASAFLALLGTLLGGAVPAAARGTATEPLIGNLAAPPDAARLTAGPASADDDEREAAADPAANVIVTGAPPALPIAGDFAIVAHASGTVAAIAEAAPTDTAAPTPAAPTSFHREPDAAGTGSPVAAIGPGVTMAPSPESPRLGEGEPAPAPTATLVPGVTPAPLPTPTVAPARGARPDTLDIVASADPEPVGSPSTVPAAPPPGRPGGHAVADGDAPIPVPNNHNEPDWDIARDPAAPRDAKAIVPVQTPVTADGALPYPSGQGPASTAAPPILAVATAPAAGAAPAADAQSGRTTPLPVAAGPDQHAALVAAMRAALVAEQAADAPAATDKVDADEATAPIPILAQASSRTAAINAAPTSQTPAPLLPLPPAERIAVAIHQAVRTGVDRIRVQLWPVELGHVELTLHVGRDHQTTVQVAAERPETLDLLQRDARGLERALADAGLKLDAGNLAFSLRHGGQGFDHAARDQRAHDDGASAPIVATVTDAAPAIRHGDPSRLVDLHA